MFKEYKDREDPCTVENIPEFADAKCVGNQFIEKRNPFAYTEDVLIIKAGATIPFYDGAKWRALSNREDIEFAPASCLDAGEQLEYGKDYYIYLCIDGGTPEIVVSLNSTHPNGSTDLTSRKIGGFHFGAIRRVSDDGKWIPIDSTGVKFGTNGTPWKNNVGKGVIPNGVWDLKHRPKVVAPGMVEVHGKWHGIYIASLEENVGFMPGQTSNVHIISGKLVSKYGKLPATGTEGLSQFNFNELAHKQGMRLPRYAETLAAAFGCPQCEDSSDAYGWAKSSNTGRTYTGCSINTGTGAHEPTGGVKPYAVSAYNLCDCAGNVWEWQSDYMLYQGGDWGTYDVLGAQMGKAHLCGSSGLHVAVCGGGWNHGVLCGPRTVYVYDYPWYVNAYIGARLACDAA